MRSTDALQDEQVVGGASPADRRQHKRKPVLWAARIETQDGPSDCIILDLSLGGAKLRSAAEVAAQDMITLVIDRFGALNAEVMWARSGKMGVRFVDAPDQIAHIIGGSLPL
ncbi:MAG TPA: PilZ domain-containing protein [Stellaceae bacterium]|nr:PilZ domain-containing protein [Stellaceae bacterium]